MKRKQWRKGGSIEVRKLVQRIAKHIPPCWYERGRELNENPCAGRPGHWWCLACVHSSPISFWNWERLARPWLINTAVQTEQVAFISEHSFSASDLQDASSIPATQGRAVAQWQSIFLPYQRFQILSPASPGSAGWDFHAQYPSAHSPLASTTCQSDVYI